MKDKYYPLNKLLTNEQGIIYNINSNKRLKNRLNSMGVIKGKRLMVLNNTFGPLVIKINQTKLGLGRGIANKIIMEYQNDKKDNKKNEF